jgi:diguanylate cyclase (GGDEF)-like protein
MATAASDPSLAGITLEMLERGVELVPIPGAHVIVVDGALRLQACNSAFRIAGLGDRGSGAPMLDALGERLHSFLQSDERRIDFDWSLGEAIDCRYYRVTFARSSSSVRHRCAVTFLDQTSRIQTERSLRREMTTDSLTGLPNREGFGDLVEAVEGLPRAAVMVVDLARFGRVNACLGSLAGDELLITVARRIKGALRARDALARIGGDEFGILVAIDEDREEASHVADRIRGALATPFRLTDYEISVDCAIGIAFGSDAVAGEAQELIRHAQFAAKRAETTGQVERYETRAFSVARAQFGMETELRRAIEQRQLRLRFQPICDLATGRLHAFEALARWRTDTGEEICPTRFIPVAEESGLIVPLGRWAIEEATRTLAAWDLDAGGYCGVQVAVNLSPIQLQRDSVELLVANALRETGLSGGRLKLELTESALVDDPDRTAATLRGLKELGTTLAMDDFGTGYSNLALLQALPIDILKIDRSFVTDMLADRNKLAIVRAILSLAQALGKRTVAEGIETHEVAQTLSALGCAAGQGYLYARPLEADDARALIASSTTVSAI